MLDEVLFSTSVCVCVCVQSGFRQVKEPSAPRCINKIVFSVFSLPVLLWVFMLYSQIMIYTYYLYSTTRTHSTCGPCVLFLVQSLDYVLYVPELSLEGAFLHTSLLHTNLFEVCFTFYIVYILIWQYDNMWYIIQSVVHVHIQHIFNLCVCLEDWGWTPKIPTARHQREAGWGEKLTFFAPPKKLALSKVVCQLKLSELVKILAQKWNQWICWLFQCLSLNLSFLGVGEVQRAGGWTWRARFAIQQIARSPITLAISRPTRELDL